MQYVGHLDRVVHVRYDDNALFRDHQRTAGKAFRVGTGGARFEGNDAHVGEREVDDAVAALSSLLEPVIIVFLGVVIGGLVVAMYLPIFKLGAVI